MTAASPVILPFKFERCAITTDVWDLQDTINVPPQINDQSPTVYPFNAPTFTYDDPSKDCAYEWTATSVIQDPSYIIFDAATPSLTLLSLLETNTDDVLTSVQVTYDLSDGVTSLTDEI